MLNGSQCVYLVRFSVTVGLQQQVTPSNVHYVSSVPRTPAPEIVSSCLAASEVSEPARSSVSGSVSDSGTGPQKRIAGVNRLFSL